MPFGDGSEPVTQLVSKEAGNWAQRITAKGLRVNDFSSKMIFEKADPAMRYSLWKKYVRKGLDDQSAANEVWVDLVRYNENSGAMNAWKAWPFNFFVPWRTGTYVSLYKAATQRPIQTLLLIGAVDYLREIRYRKSGMWTHMPHDYGEAPTAELVNRAVKAKGIKDAPDVALAAGLIAATTALFGPGGGQAPSTIKDVMSFIQNDPRERERVLNMFWGISQLYNMPREFIAYTKDGDNQHFVNMLTEAAIAEHSALKYEPRRLMKYLPEWMPFMQKSEIVRNAETLRAITDAKIEKAQATKDLKPGVPYSMSKQQQELLEARRAAGARGAGKPRPPTLPQPPRQKNPQLPVPLHY